jgi:peptidoglycan/LPS O-acetylase OafA/YrhL
MTQKHFAELDGIRGVLAVTVMAYHYGLNTAIARASGGGVAHGVWGLCVDVFFALSGFVLCRSMCTSPPGWRDYASKRWLRLAPAFLLTTALIVALDPGNAQWTAMAANVLLVQSFVGQPSLNFPAWSIPLELVLPAAGIFLVPFLRRQRAAGLVACIAAIAATGGVGYFLLLRAGSIDADASRIVRAVLGLAGGAILYLLWDAYRPRGNVLATYAAFVGSLAIMALAGVVPVLVLVFPFCVFIMLMFGAEADGVFSTRPAQAIGRWSYSIYLVHIPVLMTAERVFGEAAVRGAGPKALLMLAVVAISASVFRFVEAPFMRMGRGRGIPAQGIAPTRP